MILVKVVNGEIVKFPYTMDDLRKDNPTVSFPMVPSNEILNSYSAAQVVYFPYPIFDRRTQHIEVAQIPTLNNGVWEMRHSVVPKTAAQILQYENEEKNALKTNLLNMVDVKTNELIETGFVYLGMNVRLNTEDQNNFEGEYSMIKDYISDGVPEQYIFPTIFKIWTKEDGTPEFITFNGLGEMKSFIYSGKIYIKSCLSAGWVIKNALSVMTIDELRAWKDPRIVI